MIRRGRWGLSPSRVEHQENDSTDKYSREYHHARGAHVVPGNFVHEIFSTHGKHCTSDGDTQFTPNWLGAPRRAKGFHGLVDMALEDHIVPVEARKIRCLRCDHPGEPERLLLNAGPCVLVNRDRLDLARIDGHLFADLRHAQASIDHRVEFTSDPFHEGLLALHDQDNRSVELGTV
jgi:hypothetical protein